MNSRFKMIATVASLAVIVILLRCLWLWQPERQLLLHQQHFRQAIEKHNWSKVESMIDPAYSDRWGYTRETGIAEARQWLGQFFALTITVDLDHYAISGANGTIVERWKLDGTGTEAASMVIEHVNAVQQPFEFQWKHGSWKPWDWTLISVDNAALNLKAQDF